MAVLVSGEHLLLLPVFCGLYLSLQCLELELHVCRRALCPLSLRLRLLDLLPHRRELLLFVVSQFLDVIVLILDVLEGKRDFV
jgi:hypothetical protein